MRKVMEDVQVNTTFDCESDLKGVLCFDTHLSVYQMLRKYENDFGRSLHSSYNIRQSFNKMYQDLNEFY